jgi:hypothetical protein
VPRLRRGGPAISSSSHTEVREHSDSPRRRRLGRALCAFFVVVTSLAGAAPRSALASGARARWTRSGDARVTGYHLYVRAAGSAYGAPINVGLASPAPDGTLSSVVEGLVASRTYHLAVAAYTADGTESALSGELALGALNACAVDHCEGPTTCAFGVVPDGTWCMHDGDTDPCTAIGACVAGKCAASASAARGLASARVRIAARRGEGRLSVRGHFLADSGFDPTAADAVLELADASGAILYRATIPGGALEPARAGTAFRYLGTRREAREHNGLRVLDLFTSGDIVLVVARGESVELRAVMTEPELRVTLRFGDTCARDLTLACRTRAPGGLSCH